MKISKEQVKSRLTNRNWLSRISYFIFLASTSIGIIVLAALIYDILTEGLGWLTLDFLSNFPSRRPEQAGIKAGLFGTLWLIIFTAPVAFILGVGTAVYLEEYAKKNWFTRFIQVNISNLAGVPSIVFGLLGLTLFVQQLALGRSILAGAFTLALLVLPIIIVASQEAIRAVPSDLRHASFGLGATKWQTIRRVVLPSAIPGILTGNILALSRAIGETAPLVVIGAVTYIAVTPSSPFDKFSAMPIQIYNWISRPKEEFQYVAAAGIIVLLIVLISMNTLAVILRNKFQKKY